MKLIVQGIVLLLIISIISGIFYPSLITGIAYVFYDDKRMGSLIQEKDKIIGSYLIAQRFTDPKYFWPRPSAGDYATIPSAASNLGPTSDKLKKELEHRKKILSKEMGCKEHLIPLDLLTTSGSGLDPHISLAAARIQINRISKARSLNEKGQKTLHTLIEEHLEKEQLLVLGEKRVNVLKLNLSLEHAFIK